MVNNNEEFNQYANEVIRKWGNTSQYKEYQQKSNKSKQEIENISNEFMNIFAELGALKHLSAEDESVQEKIKSVGTHHTVSVSNAQMEIDAATPVWQYLRLNLRRAESLKTS